MNTHNIVCIQLVLNALSWWFDARATPRPSPNREVKPCSGDDTCYTGKVASRQDKLLNTKRMFRNTKNHLKDGSLCFFYVRGINCTKTISVKFKLALYEANKWY